MCQRFFLENGQDTQSSTSVAVLVVKTKVLDHGDHEAAFVTRGHPVGAKQVVRVHQQIFVASVRSRANHVHVPAGWTGW